MSHEKRSHSRIDLRCPVLTTIDGIQCEGYSINLSETGALTQITSGELSYYAEGDDGICCIMNPYGQTSHIKFTVVRVSAPELVLQFCDIDADQCEFISDLLHLGM